MKNTCVYIHRNPTTKEIFYVGIGDIKRPYEKCKGQRNSFWLRVVKKYGFPNVTIIHENLSVEEAYAIEIKMIKEIGRRDLGLGPLVNLTDGGEGLNGHKISDETKDKIRKTKLGIKNPMFGKKFSEEHKKKIGLAMSGDLHWTNGQGPMQKLTRDKISKSLLNKNLEVSQRTCDILSSKTKLSWGKRKYKNEVRIYGQVYTSIREAATVTKYSKETIKKRCADPNNNDFIFI